MNLINEPVFWIAPFHLQLVLAGLVALSQDAAMGFAIGGVCFLLLLRDRWFLSETRKGRRLVEMCGPVASIWVLRGILCFGIAFGGMLASGMVKPIRWG